MRLLPFLFLLGACNPLVGAGSFVHSVLTGNTVGVVTGGAGIVVEAESGKSMTDHVLDSIKSKDKKPEPEIGKRIEWVTQ